MGNFTQGGKWPLVLGAFWFILRIFCGFQEVTLGIFFSFAGQTCLNKCQNWAIQGNFVILSSQIKVLLIVKLVNKKYEDHPVVFIDGHKKDTERFDINQPVYTGCNLSKNVNSIRGGNDIPKSRFFCTMRLVELFCSFLKMIVCTNQ